MYRNANEGSAPEAPYIHRPIFPTFHRCSRREARHSANDGLHAVTSRITKRSLIGSCVAPSRSAQERRIISKQRGYVDAASKGATEPSEPRRRGSVGHQRDENRKEQNVHSMERSRSPSSTKLGEEIPADWPSGHCRGGVCDEEAKASASRWDS
jgi:hypothetical protein